MSALLVAEVGGPGRSFDTKLILCRIILKTPNQGGAARGAAGPASAPRSALGGPRGARRATTARQPPDQHSPSITQPDARSQPRRPARSIPASQHNSWFAASGSWPRSWTGTGAPAVLPRIRKVRAEPGGLSPPGGLPPPGPPLLGAPVAPGVSAPYRLTQAARFSREGRVTSVGAPPARERAEGTPGLTVSAWSTAAR